MKSRVKGVRAGSPNPDPRVDVDPALFAGVPTQMLPPEQVMVPGPYPSPAGMADAAAERQALQVLMLARRTADEHVAAANHQAEAICADARTTADQIVREAHDAAERARRDADRLMSEAQSRAAQVMHDAQADAEDLRREAEQERAAARTSADQAIADAQAHAAELEREAEERYAEAVGGLADERVALQQQIEALQRFDREYRTRLRVFMHGQLRALDEGEPPPADIPMPPQPMPAEQPVPADQPEQP